MCVVETDSWGSASARRDPSTCMFHPSAPARYRSLNSKHFDSICSFGQSRSCFFRWEQRVSIGFQCWTHLETTLSLFSGDSFVISIFWSDIFWTTESFSIWTWEKMCRILGKSLLLLPLILFWHHFFASLFHWSVLTHTNLTNGLFVAVGLIWFCFIHFALFLLVFFLYRSEISKRKLTLFVLWLNSFDKKRMSSSMNC